MKEFIKKFNNHNAYTAFTQTADFVKPNVSLCVQENEMHYNPWSWADEYLTFVAKESGTFTFTPSSSNVISYSTDGGETWTTGNSVEVNNGDKVMWKGTMTPQSYYGIGKFGSTGNFDVQGNVMSLLFGDNYKGQTDLTGKGYAFYELFRNNTKVISAENLSLPASTLIKYCYCGMFYGCTSLVTAPQLPATTLSGDEVWDCYNRMFQDCTSLVTAPELPATTLSTSCYGYMFKGCTSLVNAPELPATTLAVQCYWYMFEDCTSLVTAPQLPATTLASNCYYYMFRGCTGLVNAPSILPATTLANNCYGHMFDGCTSLTSAPVLPATTLTTSCYQYMFYGCTNLNYIKAMFTTTPSGSSPYYTQNWVNGVSATGTFVKNSAAQWTNTFNDNAIPTNWTVQTAST